MPTKPLLFLKSQPGRPVMLAWLSALCLLLLPLTVESTSYWPLWGAAETQAQTGITVTQSVTPTVYEQGSLKTNGVELQPFRYEIQIQNNTAINYTGPLTLTTILPPEAVCDDFSLKNVTPNWVGDDITCRDGQPGNPDLKFANWLLDVGFQLAAGETVVVYAELTTNAPDGAVLTFDDVSLLSSDPANPVLATSADSHTLTVRAPEWSISKTASPSTVAPNGLIEYQIEASNMGSYLLRNNGFTVGDRFPPEVVTVESWTPLPAGVGTVTASNSEISWQFNATPPLNPGDFIPVRPLTVAVRVTNDNSLPTGHPIVNSDYQIAGGTNVYTVGQGSPVTVSFAPNIVIELSKSADRNTAKAGDQIVYTLRVRNDATSQGTVSNIFVTDPLPAGTIYVSSQFLTGNGTADYEPTSRVARWEITDNLAPTAFVDLQLTVRVAPGVIGGSTLVNDQYTIPLINGSPTGFTLNPPPPPVSVNIIGPANLKIGKTANTALASPGDVVRYTISTTNISNEPATSVILNETVPPNTTFESGSSTPGWNCPTITAGTACTLNIGTIAATGNRQIDFAVRLSPVLAPTVNEVRNTTSVNYSSQNGIPPDLSQNAATHVLPLDVPGVLLAPDIQTDSGGPGQVINYSLTVTNTGTVPDNVIINVTPGDFPATPTGLSISLGSRESRVLNFSVTIPATATLGSRNTTGIIACSVSHPTLCDIATFVTVVAAAPDLAITANPYPAARPGEVIPYTLNYQNQTPGILASGVVITETLPSFTTFAGNPAIWQQVAGTNQYRHVVGYLPFGVAGVITFPVLVNATAPVNSIIVNTATIGDDGSRGSDPNLADNSSQVTTLISTSVVNPLPNLAFTKSDGGAVPQPGEQLVYSLFFTNSGSSSANNVLLSETVPANTTLDLNASLPTVWQCPNGPTAGQSCTANIGSLAAGSSGQAKVVVRLNTPWPTGVNQIVNSAQLATGSSTIQANSITQVNDPDGTILLTISKDDGGVQVRPGDTIIYTIVYGNQGTNLTTGVRLSEVVPAHTTFNAANSSAGWNCQDEGLSGTICRYPIGIFAANSSQQVRFAVTVNNPVPAGIDTIGNVVTILDAEGRSAADTEATELVGANPPVATDIYLPIILRSPAPPQPQKDLLVGNLWVSNRNPRTGEPVVVEVTVRNAGSQAIASSFWVDLYLTTAPLDPLPAVNSSWDEAYPDSLVPYGVAWVVPDMPALGNRVITNENPNNPADPTSNYSNFIPNGLGQWEQSWKGIPLNNYFREPGTYYLYVQVDSLGGSNGAVSEDNENNNLFGPIIFNVTGQSLGYQPTQLVEEIGPLAFPGERPTVRP